MAKKHWIQSAIKHPGALHKDLGVPQGETIPHAKIEAAAKKGGKVGARARMALTLEGMDHKRKPGNASDEAVHHSIKNAMIEKAGEEEPDNDEDD